MRKQNLANSNIKDEVFILKKKKGGPWTGIPLAFRNYCPSAYSQMNATTIGLYFGLPFIASQNFSNFSLLLHTSFGPHPHESPQETRQRPWEAWLPGVPPKAEQLVEQSSTQLHEQSRLSRTGVSSASGEGILAARVAERQARREMVMVLKRILNRWLGFYQFITWK